MILLYVVVCGRERWVIEHVIYFEGGERRGHLFEQPFAIRDLRYEYSFTEEIYN